MIVTFYRETGCYVQPITKARTGNCGERIFFFHEWEHPVVVYDAAEGTAKIYSPKENVDCYKLLTGIKSMEITA